LRGAKTLLSFSDFRQRKAVLPLYLNIYGIADIYVAGHFNISSNADLSENGYRRQSRLKPLERRVATGEVILQHLEFPHSWRRFWHRPKYQKKNYGDHYQESSVHRTQNIRSKARKVHVFSDHVIDRGRKEIRKYRLSPNDFFSIYYVGNSMNLPDHPRFHLPAVPRPPELNRQTEQNPEQMEAWRTSLFEWCILLSQVDELIEETNVNK